MNTRANYTSRSWKAPINLKPARPSIIPQTGLVVFLTTGVFFTALAQDFYNLDFEQASLIPAPGDPYGRVQFAPALPGWAGYCGGVAQYAANYNTEFLDSAGISIIDTNCFTNTYAPVPPGFIHGRFCTLIQSGNYSPVDTSIAQTGTVPPDAKSILFNIPPYLASVERLRLTFNGTPIPLAVLDMPSNEMPLGGDVSQFAGQKGELRINNRVLWYTVPSGMRFPNYGPVALDYIRFSTTPLAAPPVILAPPASQTCNMGSTVDFVVSATGCPEPVCQWWFNATNLIQGAMSPTLELTNVQFSQSGTYTVVLSNAYGVVTSAAALTVNDPFITNQPASQSSDAKQTASFSIGAGGTTPLSFQWLKNGVSLSDGGNLSGARTSTLTLSNVLGADAGNYSVIVSNTYGSVTSQLATLTVHDPLIVAQPVSQTVAPGGDALFNVVADGTAPFSYQWFNAGTRLSDGPNVSGTQTPTLTLKNVLGGEADAYWVVVANAYLSVTSQVAFVSMSTPFYAVLHHFANSAGSPYSANPNAALVSCGTTLYGTAEASVFKINTDGTGFTRITSRIEGGNGGLVLAGSMLYGATYSGSDPGQVYRVNTDGSGFAVLKSFTGGFDGGGVCAAPVLLGSALYGTAGYGGSSAYGTVFKVNTDGSDFTVLRAFDYTAEDPVGALAISGNTLYGTLTANSAYGMAAMVFKINTDGSRFALLESFRTDEARVPLSRLVLSGDTLYGTTWYGGTGTPPGLGSGTVFMVGTKGGGGILRNFTGGSDGANPSGDLVVSGRTLYGTTGSGGFSNYGTIFKIDIDGSHYTVLKRFRGSDGANPSGGLVMSGGTLYGTTSSGGISNNGVIFALSLAAPIILTDPFSQTADVGSAVAFGSDSSGYAPSYQWFFNGTNGLGTATTNSVLKLTNIQPAQAGAYTVVVTNAFGAVTSAPAFLSVIPPVERRSVPGIVLTGQVGMPFNLEYADALVPGPDWLPLATLVLPSAPQCYFDPSLPQTPQRFYRAWQPGPSSVVSTLDLHLVPALTLTGAVGSAVRVDYINQLGPTDAWVTLATVILTNTPQLYFDLSAIGQPPRLWRLTPVP